MARWRAAVAAKHPPTRQLAKKTKNCGQICAHHCWRNYSTNKLDNILCAADTERYVLFTRACIVSEWVVIAFDRAHTRVRPGTKTAYYVCARCSARGEGPVDTVVQVGTINSHTHAHTAVKTRCPSIAKTHTRIHCCAH
jgi:hypothetical protein